MPKLRTAFIATLLSLAACGGEVPDNQPGQPVAHRRAAFKEILKVFEPMGVMLRTDRYDARTFQTLAGRLVAIRAVPWDYFSAGTQYPPSHATDDVWTSADKFAEEKQRFFIATDELAAIAGTPDKGRAAAAYTAVQNSCQSCHKKFKTR